MKLGVSCLPLLISCLVVLLQSPRDMEFENVNETHSMFRNRTSVMGSASHDASVPALKSTREPERLIMSPGGGVPEECL